MKGSRVIATGRLTQRSHQDREGNPRTSIELQVDEIGPSLRYATAQVVRAAGSASRGDGGRGSGSAGGSWPAQAEAASGPSGGDWAADGDMPF